MKKGLTFLVVLFIFIQFSNGQRWKLKRYEAIAGLGTVNVFGDVGGADEKETLGGFKDIKFGDIRPSLYLGARYRLTEEQSIKINLTTGYGSGNDINSRNYPGRTHKFSTFLFEPSFQYEYYFLPEDRNMKTSAMYSRRGMVNTFSMISLYAFTGFGGVLYAPNFVAGESPAPLREHSSNELGFAGIIPLGLGLKYVVTSEFSLNLEIGRRFTRNDYIDGLTTDFSKANDLYYFGTLSVVYKLTTTRRGIPILFENRSKGSSRKGPRKGRKPMGF